MGYSQGTGLLWVLFCFVFLFLHIPTILGKVGSRNANSGKPRAVQRQGIY